MRLVLKNVLFTLIVPGTVGIYFPRILAREDVPKPGFTLPVSLGTFAFALAIYLWSVWHFASRGRATPLPIDAPKSLMVQGPYRYTRNPMYLALFSALLGWLFLYQTFALLLYAMAVAAVVAAFVTRYEEPHLQDAFGAEYSEYKARVPRWLPKVQRIPDV